MAELENKSESGATSTPEVKAPFRLIRVDKHGNQYDAIDRGDGRDKEGRLLPGYTSNPGGRPKKKPLTEALLEAIENHPELVEQAATNLLIRALGDTQAFKELRDTVQGKPALTIAGDEENPLQVNVNDARAKLLSILGK